MFSIIIVNHTVLPGLKLATVESSTKSLLDKHQTLSTSFLMQPMPRLLLVNIFEVNILESRHMIQVDVQPPLSTSPTLALMAFLLLEYHQVLNPSSLSTVVEY